MDNKLILLEAHKLGIKLNRPRKFYKTGQKGKALAHIYKTQLFTKTKHHEKDA